MKWYVLNTMVGSEEKVKKLIELAVERSGMQDMFGEIFIPSERLMSVKDGKKKELKKKVFPGYIIIEMELTNETQNLIRGVKGVGPFVGAKNKPVPLGDDDIKKLKEESEDRKTALKPKITFTMGEKVRIIDGPFASFTGMIDNVMAEKSKLRVMVSIFGRQTPVELDYFQVEKVTN